MTTVISADQFEVKISPLFGPINKKLTCDICKMINIKVRHRHHSTMFARDTLRRQWKADMECVSCKISHNREIKGDRYKVLVTSSILHNIWLESSVRNPFHIDNISICGATMETCRLNFEQAYSRQDKAVDVVVQCGLNDIRRTKIENFKQEMLKWIWSVKAHGRRYGRENTIGFIKMPHAPSIAWLPGDGFHPIRNFHNLMYKVDTFNRIIGEVNTNSSMCENMVNFQKIGQYTTREGVRRHDWGSWREQRPEDMLHLKDHIRAKMYKKIIKYFEICTIHSKEDSYVE